MGESTVRAPGAGPQRDMGSVTTPGRPPCQPLCTATCTQASTPLQGTPRNAPPGPAAAVRVPGSQLVTLSLGPCDPCSSHTSPRSINHGPRRCCGQVGAGQHRGLHGCQDALRPVPRTRLPPRISVISTFQTARRGTPRCQHRHSLTSEGSASSPTLGLTHPSH